MAARRSPEEAEEIRQMYRNVFGSMEGRIVLGDILDTAEFGEKINPNDPAQVSWYNCAIEIARLAGAFDQIYQNLGMAQKEN